MRWRGGASRLAGCCALLAAGAALASCAGGSGGNSADSNSPAGTSPARASPGSASPGKASPGSTSPASSPGRTKIIGIAQFALPPAGQGCTGARRLPGGGTSIPVTVSTRQSQVAAMANVCINGQGPFPFIIDTGAQGSVVTAALATRLGLPKTSQPGSTAVSVKIRFGTQPPLAFTPDTGASQSAVDTAAAARAGLASTNARVRQGTVCTIAVLPEVRTGPWSVAGHRLRPQPVGVIGLQRTTGVAGLLGADQMSRFGSVIFDYAGGRLVLGAG